MRVLNLPYSKVVRTKKTWLIYIFLCCYLFFMTLSGPINSFLKREFQLDYTMVSLHASAFALGVTLTGLFGHLLIPSITHFQGLVIGAIGLGVGGLMIGFGDTPLITILGLFITGLLGTLILAIYPIVLKEEMNEYQALGISEGNMFGLLISALTPLLIGSSIAIFQTWRPVVIIFSMGVMIFSLVVIRDKETHIIHTMRDNNLVEPRIRLSREYWLFWICLLLGLSVQFCTINWASLFTEAALGLRPTQAAMVVSLYLFSMVMGRLIVNKIVLRYSRINILTFAIIFASLGFGLFWWSPSVITTLLGLVFMGLGVGNFYTLILSLALDYAGGLESRASSRATLASGIAILSLPLMLGMLADRLGIRVAFGLVGILLLALVGALRFAYRKG